jgi:hypothetical protein
MVSSRFWNNWQLADLERESGIRNLRLTMIGLWAVADESGIFEWEPRTLAGLIYPYNSDDQKTVAPAMEAFAHHEDPLLLKVEVNGKAYGVWPNWGEHNDFRENKSRYPEVLAVVRGEPSDTLINPREGTSTLESPSEREVESEVEVESMSECLNGEETTSVSGQEEPKPVEVEIAIQLARTLHHLLDKPKEHAVNSWHREVAALLTEHSAEEIAGVMEFAVKDNDFSAEYLTLAKNPMASFVKNYDNLFRRWKALQKGAAAAANRAAKLAKPAETKTAPGAHGNKSGMEF